MTVQTTNSTAVFDGNGVTTDFPITFPFKQNSDIKVYSKDASGIVLPVLSGFTVEGEGSPSGGWLRMAAPPALGTKLVAAREMVIRQLIDLRNQGKFFPETHEEAFDILTMLIQQVSEQVARAVKSDITGAENPDQLIAELYAAADAAAVSAGQAATSASAASNSATAASSSATTAGNSATLAQKWAEEAEDVPVTVTPDKFSAKHWAAKAAASLSSVLASIVSLTSRVTTLENIGKPFTKSYETGELTIANGALVTITHNLGAEPKAILAIATMTAADSNRSIGSKYLFWLQGMTGNANVVGVEVQITSNNAIEIRGGSQGIGYALNNTTGGTTGGGYLLSTNCTVRLRIFA